MDKVANYTPDQVAKIVADYKAGVSVEAIAQAVGKTTRSVVAKLSREGVYEAKAKVTSPRTTKEDLVGVIAVKLGLMPSELDSFAKANREQLALVAAKLG